MSAHLCETEHDVSQQLAEVSVVLCISRILSITLSFKGIPCANATAWWTGRSGIAMALSYDERRGDTVRYKSDVAVGVIAHGSAHVKLRVRPRNHNMFTRTADDAGRKFSVGQRGWDGDGVAIGEGSDLLRDLREEQNHRFVRVGLWLLVAFDGDCGRKETSLRVICKTISRNSQRRFQGKRTKTRIPSVSPSSSPTTPCQTSPPARGIPRSACWRNHRNSPLQYLNGHNQEVHQCQKERGVEEMVEEVETFATGQVEGQNQGDQGTRRGHRWCMSSREILAQ